MGPGYGFAFCPDQFFAWVGGQLSTDGHHYLILSKNGDNYDIFFDGSVMPNYGAGIGDKRSDYTVKLFATDIGNYTYFEKLQGTIEIFKVYNATTPVSQFNAIYEQMKS
jgi:hypothetical protein